MWPLAPFIALAAVARAEIILTSFEGPTDGTALTAVIADGSDSLLNTRVEAIGPSLTLDNYSEHRVSCNLFAQGYNSRTFTTTCTKLVAGIGNVRYTPVFSFQDGTLAIPKGEFNFYDPSITTLEPSSAPTAGGSIVVHGANFGNNGTGAINVYHLNGGVSFPWDCVLVAAHSALNCSVPPGTGNRLTLIVEANGAQGQSFFRYDAPVITAAHGPADGSDLTVEGNNFGDSLTTIKITLDKKACMVRTVEHTKATIACNLHGAGNVGWTVTVEVNTQRTSAEFNYNAPTIESVSPSVVPIKGTELVIHGTNFGVEQQKCTAELGGRECRNCVTVTDTEARCTMPGVGDIETDVSMVFSLSISNVVASYNWVLSWHREESDNIVVTNELTSLSSETLQMFGMGVLMLLVADVIIFGVFYLRLRARRVFYERISNDLCMQSQPVEQACMPKMSPSHDNIVSLTVHVMHTGGRSGPPSGKASANSTVLGTRSTTGTKRSGVNTTDSSSPESSFVPLSALGSDSESEGRAISTFSKGTVFYPHRTTTLSVDLFPLSVSPEKISFGQDRNLANVREVLLQRIFLTNHKKYKQHVRLYAPVSQKFVLKVSPAEKTLLPGASESFDVTLECLCTMELNECFRIVCCAGGWSEYYKERNMHFVYEMKFGVQTKLSTHLDSDDINIYHAKPELGSGSYGVVRLGRWRTQDVAVKIMRENSNPAVNKQNVENFHHEVEMLEKLRHPAIVNFIGSVDFDTCHAIVMEFCPYKNYSQAMKDYIFPHIYKMRVLQNAAQAMSFLHDSNIIHRDLKPENLLIVNIDAMTGVVAKLNDFGTALDLSHDERREMRLSENAGTQAFMAPEIRDGKNYGIQVDVYSFGVLALVSLLEQDALRLVRERVNPRWWNDIPEEDVPPRVLNLIQRCCEDDCDRPNFAEIVVFLDEYLQDLVDQNPTETKGRSRGASSQGSQMTSQSGTLNMGADPSDPRGKKLAYSTNDRPFGRGSSRPKSQTIHAFATDATPNLEDPDDPLVRDLPRLTVVIPRAPEPPKVNTIEEKLDIRMDDSDETDLACISDFEDEFSSPSPRVPEHEKSSPSESTKSSESSESSESTEESSESSEERSSSSSSDKRASTLSLVQRDMDPTTSSREKLPTPREVKSRTPSMTGISPRRDSKADNSIGRMDSFRGIIGRRSSKVEAHVPPKSPTRTHSGNSDFPMPSSGVGSPRSSSRPLSPRMGSKNNSKTQVGLDEKGKKSFFSMFSAHNLRGDKNATNTDFHGTPRKVNHRDRKSVAIVSPRHVHVQHRRKQSDGVFTPMHVNYAMPVDPQITGSATASSSKNISHGGSGSE